MGVFQFLGGQKACVVSNRYLADALNLRGQATMYRIVTSPHDAATQDRVCDSVTAELKRLGYKATVTSLHTVIDMMGAVLNTIVMFLAVMALLLAVVGGLGLSGTMSMNVLERTREIGVMRSIGAINKSIFQLVVVEGMLIGVISWLYRRAHRPGRLLPCVPGVATMLRRLSGSYPMAVVSARDELSTVTFLRRSGLRPYFRSVVTALSAPRWPEPIWPCVQLR